LKRLCTYDWFIIGYETGLSSAVVKGAVVLGLAAAAALVFRRRSPLVTLALLWLVLGLLPVSQIVPIIIVAAERFLYIPMLGWVLLVGLLASRAIGWAEERGRARLAMAAVALLFLAYAVRTVSRVPDWRNDETLNLATAEWFPETPGPYLNLATYYERFEHDPAKALAALAEADKRAPGWKPVLARTARLKAAMAPPSVSP
jgi:hypothetical protein